MIITLPYPPSVNHYWIHTRRGAFISKKGVEFRKQVHEIAQTEICYGRDTRLFVDVSVWVPDKRKRDLDNLLKSLLDALQHADIFADDSQIDDLRITRVGWCEGGKVTVKISEIS